MPQELFPCKHCGGNLIMFTLLIDPPKYRFNCNDCGMYSPTCNNREQALNWYEGKVKLGQQLTFTKC